MKKLLFLPLFLLIAVFADAQSLGFSQGIFFNAKVNVPINTIPRNIPNDTTITVPVGRMWKIQSISSGYQASNITYLSESSGIYQVYLNGTQIYGIGPGNTGTPLPEFPIWLPAGTYNLQFFYDNGSSYTTLVRQVNFFFSALEFEIVP